MYSSRVLVRVGMDVSEWFPVGVGLRGGCVMSQCLFNVYINGEDCCDAGVFGLIWCKSLTPSLAMLTSIIINNNNNNNKR